MNRSIRYTVVVVFFLAFLLPFASAQDPARFQKEIDQYKADPAGYQHIDSLVLFTGSSTMRMWTGLAGDFPGRNVLNRGFGGSEMSDLLYYADTLILQYRPVLVFIYEGDNDIASGKTPDQVLNSAGKLVDLIRNKLPETVICFIAPKPSILRWNLKDSYLLYNRQLKAYTGEQQNVYYLDMWDRMMGADGKPDPALFLEDGLHMNRSGYIIWKGIIGEFLTNHMN